MTVNMTIAKIMYMFYSRSSRDQSNTKEIFAQHNEHIFYVLYTLYWHLNVYYILGIKPVTYSPIS